MDRNNDRLDYTILALVLMLILVSDIEIAVALLIP